MTRLEPLKFQPSLHAKIWGTQDLRPVFEPVRQTIGEAWCLHDGSEVVAGPLKGRSIRALIGEFKTRIMGPSWSTGGHNLHPSSSNASPLHSRGGLPIAGKLLFGTKDLSIQVHPDDQAAQSIEGLPGKTELWYVIDAQPGARLGLGLKTALDPEHLAQAAVEGSLEQHVRWVPASCGQCVLVPAGTVHSAGGGVILCEIQQNSDITYRLYDYRRKDLDGQLRPLQVERAVSVARTASQPRPQAPELLKEYPFRVEALGRCPHFVAELLHWNRPFLYTPDRLRAQILICIGGRGALNAMPFVPGDTFLIPAESARFPVDGLDVRAVRAYLP